MSNPVFWRIYICIKYSNMLSAELAQRAVKFVCVEVFDPVNPMGSCRARSVYLTTRLLGRLSPLSG